MPESNIDKYIDFSKQLREEPELDTYLKDAKAAIAKQEADTLAKIIKPTFDENMESHLIVTEIPDITGKEDKFLTLFRALLDKKKIGGLKQIEVGYKGDGTTSNQTLYLIFNTSAAATTAYKKLHLLKFTPKNTLQCFTVKQFHTVENLEGEYTEPINLPKKELISHNLDEDIRDQLIYRSLETSNDSLTLKWFDHVEKSAKDIFEKLPEQKLALTGKAKTILFSSRGSYLAVCTDRGVELYMGEALKFKAIFQHKLTTNASFSPNQKYLVTYSDSNPHECLVLWAIEEEVKMHSIRTAEYIDVDSIRFNKSESKMAVLGENQVSVYDSSEFEQLKESLKMSEQELIEQGRLLKAANLKKICWMPDETNLLLVCYQLNPAINSHSTSKIYFIDTKTKEERKWKPIGQHIKKVEIILSDNDDWVAVSFKKVHKKDMGGTSIFIVDLSQKVVATETKDFKERVTYIAWDRRNSRFGLVFELGDKINNPHVNFGVYIYQMDHRNGISAVEACRIAETPLNRLILSRNGTYFAMYNVTRESSGRDKYSIGYLAKSQGNKLTVEYIKQKVDVGYMRFFGMGPTGRFIIFGTDKGFQVWSMAGELLFKETSTYDVQNVQFRPRYYQNISIAEEKTLLGMQKELKTKFEEQDLKKTNALAYQREQEQKKRRQQFKQFIASKNKWFEQYRPLITEGRGFDEWGQSDRTSQYIYYERTRT